MKTRTTKDHPTSFVCPLSLQVMEDPVLDRCNHSFERTAIEDYIAEHHCCPISHRQLSMEDLQPNHVLAERHERWEFYHKQQQFDIEQQQQQGKLEEEGVYRKKTRGDSTLWTLLPQEREALRQYEVKQIQEEAKHEGQRRRFRCRVASVVFAFALITLWVLRASKNEDEIDMNPSESISGDDYVLN